MGNRVHIVARREHTEIHEDGMEGFNLKVLYSNQQKHWFNNDEFLLADWFNDYTDNCYVEGDVDEWVINLEDLQSISDEGFKNPIRGYTEGEMREFVAECIRCAKLTDEECHLEWW